MRIKSFAGGVNQLFLDFKQYFGDHSSILNGHPMANSNNRRQQSQQLQRQIQAAITTGVRPT